MLPGALRTAFWPPSPPFLAGGGAGLALYVQTPDQPHSGHYVIKSAGVSMENPSFFTLFDLLGILGLLAQYLIFLEEPTILT